MKTYQRASSTYWKLNWVCMFALLTIGLVMMFAFAPMQTSQAAGLARSLGNSSLASLTSTPVITIGVGAVLSGPDSILGWPEANAVQLAISQTNAAGGINVGGITYTLALVMADDGCNPTQGATAAGTLINAGAVAVVGYSCSSASRAAEPIHNLVGVPMVSPSSSAPNVTQLGYNIVFRTVTQDGAPSSLLATHFRKWLGLGKTAIVEGSTGSLPGNAYQNTFAALGGTVVTRQVVTNTSGFAGALSAIQSANADSIAIIDYNLDQTAAGQFSQAAHNAGLTNVAIGWSTFTNYESVLTTYASAAGAAAAQGNFAAMEFRRTQDMPGYSAFYIAYLAANFPNSPTDTVGFSPYAYDAARIIIDAIVRAGSTNPTAIRNAIANTQNFQGVVGTYQGFDSYGDVIPQWAWLERYQNGQWVILNPSQLFLPLILR